MPVARWTVDCHAGIHQPLASLVNIIDLIGEMTKIAAARIILRVPIIGQFEKRRLISSAGGLIF